ncbi:hypothetical protein A3B02_02485 [Candidatus Roizmanbacteria bacterium RIFCSPLOWO2_01_FULL_42_14]|uniref:Uncharacterized protein n=1 Tax=Candidatus Roizmanbacteria bacterium RIFCSPLOWO2_01_FULL_42_14 TaxID=1802068 RepID=A0A1F7J861_9BACT|nr:MAG: hypothetical protein A3B02_02485 [Candidatus Roizmanbacteria bacterium RIFCSPLOWO2_01_FULL_42_14]
MYLFRRLEECMILSTYRYSGMKAGGDMNTPMRVLLTTIAMLLIPVACLFQSTDTVSARRNEPVRTVRELLPNGMQGDPYTITTRVGQLVTGTVYCHYGRDQFYYIETSAGRETVGIPQGPFSFYIRHFVGETLWMYGVTQKICDVDRFWSFWWVVVQSQDKPYPPGEQFQISGRLDYKPGSLPELWLERCDGATQRPALYLIVEHDPALTEQLKQLHGKSVTLSVIEAEGLDSRPTPNWRVRHLWVTELVSTTECGSQVTPSSTPAPESPTPEPLPTSTATQEPEPTAKVVEPQRLFLPVLLHNHEGPEPHSQITAKPPRIITIEPTRVTSTPRHRPSETPTPAWYSPVAPLP